MTIIDSSPHGDSDFSQRHNESSPNQMKYRNDLFKNIVIFSAFFKILLFPAYHSTDFEVHRNWMATTTSLPLSQWYTDETCRHTLDYPPFFAYYEYFLGKLGHLFDPRMTQLSALPYASTATIYFQRSTVILSELLLYFALRVYMKKNEKPGIFLASIAIFLSPILLIVDHMHFQYNGFLLGIFVLALAYAQHLDTIQLSVIIFTVLLCFKHIFLYAAPPFAANIVFRHFLTVNWKPFSVKIHYSRVYSVLIPIALILLACFGPFIATGSIKAVFQRLFPFGRGISHTSPAPNFWTLYVAADKLLMFLAPTLGIRYNESAVGSFTRGIEGDTKFAVLPSPTPLNSFSIVLTLQIMYLVVFALIQDNSSFLECVTLCSLSAFLFGWHVHEKAIIITIIPVVLLSCNNRRYLHALQPMLIAGVIAQFPLIFTQPESFIKIVYTASSAIITIAMQNVASIPPEPRIWYLDRLIDLYITGFIPVLSYYFYFHNYFFGTSKYQYLPLLLLNCYCGWGILWSFLSLTALYMQKLSHQKNITNVE